MNAKGHALALFAVALFGACGGTPSSSFGDGGAGAPTQGGSGSGGTDAAIPGAGLGGDATTCSGDLAVQGCSCTPAGKSGACWTGPASQRNVGACHDGTAQCAMNGEFAAWGPCQGEQLNCGVSDASVPPPDTGVGAGPMGGEDTGVGMGPMGGEDAGCPPANGLSGGCPIGYYNPYCVSQGGGITCTYNGPGPFCCAPCGPAQCSDPTLAAACCLSAACATAPACQSCQGQQLDPLCAGQLASDCDDYPEDCDELCCPCKPAGTCPSCPAGQISCNGACVDASTNDHCGACDTQCIFGQQCVHAQCQ